MDDGRLDSLTRTFAGAGTRRGALAAMAGSGLLAAFGRSRAPAAAQGAACVLSLTTNIRLGPSAGQMLASDASRPGTLQGELSFEMSDAGAIDNGSLKQPDGSKLTVVG